MPDRRPYPSDLSDDEWEILEPLLPTPNTPGRRPKAYERLPETSGAMVYGAMSRLMLRRLAKQTT